MVIPQFNRIALSAAHVVSLKDNPTQIDWQKTLEYRHYLWSLGFGVAEAMDTAQRGMGLSWENSLKLIGLAKQENTHGLLYSGVGTDHLAAGNHSLNTIIDAYLFQIEAVQNFGGKIILMASRALAKTAKTPEDYLHIYHRILAQVSEPVILHWLGEMFDPALKGYWGKSDHNQAMAVCLEMIEQNVSKINGIKLSLLDKAKEIDLRSKLPTHVLMYTGDDFNYPELIAGDGQNYSHALLGIFDAIAPIASRALVALKNNNLSHYHKLLTPTVELSRHIFQAPTQFYKTGVVFMAYINGHQDHFTMLDQQQKSRSFKHLVELYRLAKLADLIADVDQADFRLAKLQKA